MKSVKISLGIMLLLAMLAPEPAVFAAGERQKSLPDIQKEIELVGTITSADAQVNRAIIRNLKTSSQAVYKQGAVIPSVAKIIKVSSEKVWLEKNGRKVCLKLCNTSQDHAGYRKISENKWQVNPRKLFPEIGDVINVLGGISFSKFYDENGFQGFRVDKLDESHLLAQLGLKVGDIIVSINGERFSSVADIIGFLWDVDDDSSLDIELYRGEEKQELSYSVAYEKTPVYTKKEVLSASRGKSKSAVILEKFAQSNVVYK